MVYWSLLLLFLGSLSCLSPAYAQGTAEDEKRLFAQGPAPAKGDNGKWGFRSSDGSWGVEPKFVEVKPFQEELAAARENTTWGYLDKTGNWKIPPRFSWAGDFSENLAPACEGDRLTGKFGYIDRQGRWAIEGDYIWARPFQEGLGAVKDGGKWGFVNSKGKLVVEPEYDQVQSFSGKLAAVQKGGAPGDKETWFYIKPEGEKAFEKKFAWAGSFYEGMARVQTDDRITGKFGYINLKGELVIPAIYDEASDFRGGRAQVRVGAQTKMIDGQGKSSE